MISLLGERMKRRLITAALLACIGGVLVACGDSSDGSGAPPALPGIGSDSLQNDGSAAVPENCADAKLSQNMTADEYAVAFAEFSAVTDTRPGALTEEERQANLEASRVGMLDMFGSLVSATPAGGQASYAKVVCADMVQTAGTSIDLRTAVLTPGYTVCVSLQTSAEIAATETEAPPTVDPNDVSAIVAAAAISQLTAPVIESTTPMVTAAQEHLCPQYPLPSNDVAAEGPQFCEREVTQGNTKGAVLVAIGSVECDTAIQVVEESFKQLVKEGRKGVFYAAAGVEYACNIMGAAVADEKGYDYGCESPTGDTVIIWKANDN